LEKKLLVDLFAGAGGLSCGLEMAGFSPILANEIDPNYAETYKRNHPSTKVIVDDIRKICDGNIKKTLGLKSGELDLLAGGPPCQGFSINAPIRSLDDERNHLFKDYLRVAEAINPKAILIENVPGIISLGKGTVVEQIYKELNRMGYSVSHRILFAGHYGVPQMRFRTTFLAIMGKGKVET
jgi:DNA (cytosine-5)-methyltransferase 1